MRGVHGPETRAPVRCDRRARYSGTPFAPCGWPAISVVPPFACWAVTIEGSWRRRTSGMATMQDKIREVLAQSGRLAVPVDSLDDTADLFAAGLDSLAIVNVLMNIEECFDIELPDELLSRRTFASIATLTCVVADLTERTTST